MYSREMKVQEIKESTQERSEGNLENGVKNNMKANIRIIPTQKSKSTQTGDIAETSIAQTLKTWPSCKDFLTLSRIKEDYREH